MKPFSGKSCRGFINAHVGTNLDHVRGGKVMLYLYVIASDVDCHLPNISRSVNITLH